MVEWFADFTRVSFGGIEKIFDVSSVFCEFTINGQLYSIKHYDNIPKEKNIYDNQKKVSINSHIKRNIIFMNEYSFIKYLKLEVK